MKIVALFILCCFTGIIAFAQPGTDWKQLYLSGKVKSISTQQTYRYKKEGKWTEWEKTYRKYYLFNSQGKYAEYQDYGLDGKMSYKVVYTYSPKEKKNTQQFFDKEGKAGITKTHLLNANGQVVEEIEYTREGVADRRYVSTVDAKGNRLTMTGYKADGTMTSKTSWTYNEKGKAISYLVETPGYANSSRKFSYDEKGNLTEETWINGKGTVDYRYVRSYDEKGNKIQELTYKGQDQLRGLTKWTYEYDKAGNWIKRTETTSDGMDFNIEERTIVYY